MFNMTTYIVHASLPLLGIVHSHDCRLIVVSFVNLALRSPRLPPPPLLFKFLSNSAILHLISRNIFFSYSISSLISWMHSHSLYLICNSSHFSFSCSTNSDANCFQHRQSSGVMMYWARWLVADLFYHIRRWCNDKYSHRQDNDSERIMQKTYIYLVDV